MGKEQPIGFFDSGLGGLSVMAAAMNSMQGERFVYYGDSANAPYGTRSDEEVLALSRHAVTFLVKLGIKALVIACNTATGAAADALREEYSFPIIGLEPALKPAAMARESGRILVMATPLTLESGKFERLYAQYGENAIKLPCPGLMEFVEREEFDSPELHDYLSHLFSPYKHDEIGAIVLGCTHYLFLRQQIARHLPPDTPIYDSNDGVIRQLRRRLSAEGLLSDSGQGGSVVLYSSGDAVKLEQMERMLRKAQHLPE